MRSELLADPGIVPEERLGLRRSEDQDVLLNLGNRRIESENIAGQRIGMPALGHPGIEMVEVSANQGMVDAYAGHHEGVGLQGDLAFGAMTDLLGLHLAEKIGCTRIDRLADRVSRSNGNRHSRKEQGGNNKSKS